MSKSLLLRHRILSRKTNPQVITAGLKMHLDAGNLLSYPQGGSANWFDLTDNNHDAVLVNGPVYNDVNGGTITFDGVDDYAIIPDSTDFIYGTGDFTLDFWFYVRSYPPSGHDQYVYARCNSGNNHMAILAMANKKALAIFGGSTVLIYSSQIYNLNEWYNVAVTRVGGVFKLYMNAVLGDTASANLDLTESHDISLGAPFAGFGTATPYDGDIAIVKNYKGVGLTATEIQQNFDAVKSRFGY